VVAKQKVSYRGVNVAFTTVAPDGEVGEAENQGMAVLFTVQFHVTFDVSAAHDLVFYVLIVIYFLYIIEGIPTDKK
jgi:hypothetical protein